MGNCQLSVDLCLKERRRSMSFMPGDPRNWGPSPCLSCKVGKARQQERHVPEPDPVDDPTKLARPFKIEPTPCMICGVIVNKPSYRTRCVCKPCYYAEKKRRAEEARKTYKCEKCGGDRTKYAKLCNPCYKATRAVPDMCMEKGCERKSRRKGLCDHHYYTLIAPHERERKRKANIEAAKKYREISHRIAQQRMSKPKNRVVKHKETKK